MNSKAYTDFNDLHVVCGLEEVSKQVNSAISSLQFSPEPPINEAHNFQGQTLDEMESNAVFEGVQGSISQENDAPVESKQKPEINGSWRHTPFRKPLQASRNPCDGSWRHTPFRNSR